VIAPRAVLDAVMCDRCRELASARPTRCPECKRRNDALALALEARSDGTARMDRHG
jgi:hypothetical protein